MQAAFDLIRGPTSDSKNCFGLDRGRGNPIRRGRRDYRRDLQARPADDNLALPKSQLMKKFILAFIAAYMFLFLWGWLLNGVFLKDVYAETPNLWRTQSEMLSLFHWIILGQALVVFAFVMIYASGFAGGGVRAGIQLGILLEIAAIGMRMGFYAVQPLPGKLVIYGSVSGLIEMIIVGAIVGTIYKPGSMKAVS
jgi:hypothetical protein